MSEGPTFSITDFTTHILYVLRALDTARRFTAVIDEVEHAFLYGQWRDGRPLEEGGPHVVPQWTSEASSSPYGMDTLEGSAVAHEAFRCVGLAFAAYRKALPTPGGSLVEESLALQRRLAADPFVWTVLGAAAARLPVGVNMDSFPELGRMMVDSSSNNDRAHMLKSLLSISEPNGGAAFERVDGWLRGLAAVDRLWYMDHTFVPTGSDVYGPRQFLFLLDEQEHPMYRKKIRAEPVAISTLYDMVWTSGVPKESPSSSSALAGGAEAPAPRSRGAATTTAVTLTANLTEKMSDMVGNCGRYLGLSHELRARCQTFVAAGLRTLRHADVFQLLAQSDVSLVQRLHEPSKIRKSEDRAAWKAVRWAGEVLERLTRMPAATKGSVLGGSSSASTNTNGSHDGSSGGMLSTELVFYCPDLYPIGGPLPSSSPAPLQQEPPTVVGEPHQPPVKRLVVIRSSTAAPPTAASSSSGTQLVSGGLRADADHRRPKRQREEPSHQSKHLKAADADTTVYWVQCDACDEWREVPRPVDPQRCPRWECPMGGFECDEAARSRIAAAAAAAASAAAEKNKKGRKPKPESTKVAPKKGPSLLDEEEDEGEEAVTLAARALRQRKTTTHSKRSSSPPLANNGHSSSNPKKETKEKDRSTKQQQQPPQQKQRQGHSKAARTLRPPLDWTADGTSSSSGSNDDDDEEDETSVDFCPTDRIKELGDNGRVNSNNNHGNRKTEPKDATGKQGTTTTKANPVDAHLRETTLKLLERQFEDLVVKISVAETHDDREVSSGLLVELLNRLRALREQVARVH